MRTKQVAVLVATFHENLVEELMGRQWMMETLLLVPVQGRGGSSHGVTVSCWCYCRCK